ncbi:D-tyrosyl-tRNA(Tyr) deacylase [Selenomonas sp. oral taxon 892 str. F0426]|uniref:D-aminoacyl-tRNA deacylase n=1 Tax=Selenomonas sp. oral taxon 892 TaxID=1321785 RepID=UPI0003AD6E11|nr:D-aminoacyl-tRNA deacylase [Selenomonas sp. oral taxon 892]ERJ92925.1 D-tyrosyl-tRNA(Tyr) deacylase [Selenomonas sp. oral taxon 892 str. F0426]
MRAVVTRVKEASVQIDGDICGQIKAGYLILLGIAPTDTAEDAARLAEKIVHLRVFSDEAGKMNHAIAEVGGAVLVISQFTLFADLKKRRPGFSKAAKPGHAIPLYEEFIAQLTARNLHVEHGEFGADMQVSSVNDGPVTLLFDTTEV